MIETYRWVVYPAELDHMGHMNVMWYTSKFDQSTWHFFASLGITPSYIRENNCGMAALEATTKYLAEVMAGDLLVINSKILELRDKTIKFQHVMINAETNEVVASTEMIGAHLDREKRRACSFPEEIRGHCDQLLSSD